MSTKHRVVRKAIVQPAQLNRPSTPNGRPFASGRKCKPSLTQSLLFYLVYDTSTEAPRHSCATWRPYSGTRNSSLCARKRRRRAFQDSNLYAFPTVAIGPTARLVSKLVRCILACCRKPRRLPLPRDAIPQEDDSLEVNISVWPRCSFHVQRLALTQWCSDGVCGENSRLVGPGCRSGGKADSAGCEIGRTRYLGTSMSADAGSASRPRSSRRTHGKCGGPGLSLPG